MFIKLLNINVVRTGLAGWTENRSGEWSGIPLKSVNDQIGQEPGEPDKNQC